VRWTVVIPVKALPGAKSRLLPASTDGEAHRRLVEAIRADTVAAAQAAAGVARVLFVVDRAAVRQAGSAGADALVVVQSAPGLNPALAEAAEHAARHWPQDGVAALVGDLPALRAAELADALTAASHFVRAFVPDHDGTGTTLLAARPGEALLPAFGAGSAERHRRVATELTAGAGLQRDVDTAADLAAAQRLTLGPATAHLLHRAEDVTPSST
jgi:2-phospho-L-lactate guanylyltransferase